MNTLTKELIKETGALIKEHETLEEASNAFLSSEKELKAKIENLTELKINSLDKTDLETYFAQLQSEHSEHSKVRDGAESDSFTHQHADGYCAALVHVMDTMRTCFKI